MAGIFAFLICPNNLRVISCRIFKSLFFATTGKSSIVTAINLCCFCAKMFKVKVKITAKIKIFIKRFAREKRERARK